MAHSSDFVRPLLDTMHGAGGRRLLVIGQETGPGTYWMGLRFNPVATLFEAVLRCVLAGTYDRVIAFTGSSARALPRRFRLAANLNLGDQPMIWVAKGEAPVAPQEPAAPTNRLPWDGLTDLKPAHIERILWSGANINYWTRIRKLIETRDRELAAGRRSAFLVDAGYLEPTGADWNLFDGTTSLGLTAADSNAITDQFVVRKERLGKSDLIVFSEAATAMHLADGSSFLATLCSAKVPRWSDIAPKIESLLPSIRLHEAEIVEARRLLDPLRPLLEIEGNDAAPVYDLLRRSAISHRASKATPPQDPRRIALEFWANLDLEPISRAFDNEIIGQARVKSEILRLLTAHSTRCRRLLSANPRIVRTANDREYLPPVIGLFGAAGMGKTTFCRVLSQNLFGDELFTRIVDLSAKLLSTETVGVAPPYQGNDQESNLMRFARETGGLGLFCFDEFTRIQRHNQSLADALSPMLEIIEGRSFTPANARFVPSGGRYYLSNTIFVLAGNLARPDEPTPVGFTSMDDLGEAFKRRVFGKGDVFYFDSLAPENYEAAFQAALRRHTLRILTDFFPDRGDSFDVQIDAQLSAELVARFETSLRSNGNAPSLALIDGMAQRLSIDRVIEQALAREEKLIRLTREVLE